MFNGTEILDLYAVTTRPPRAEWVDGSGGMEAVIEYLMEHPDAERSFFVADIGDYIRATAYFAGDQLMLRTSRGEVVRG